MTRPIPVLTEREQVRRVAAKWREQYPPSAAPDRPGGLAGFREHVYRRLCALDPETATAADVEAIIGNDSWVCPTPCHQCGHKSWECVRLGQEPDYDASNAIICRECLVAAIEALDAAGAKP